MPVKEPSPKYSQLLKRNKELEAIHVKFEGSNLSRLVDAYDEFKKGLEDIIAIEERRNRGEAETATRAREALAHDYTHIAFSLETHGTAAIPNNQVIANGHRVR